MAEQQKDIPLPTSITAPDTSADSTATLQEPPSHSRMLPDADNTSAANLRSMPPPASGSNHSSQEDRQGVRNDSGAIAESVSNCEEEPKVPLDVVRLTLLLISGDRHVFEFDPSTKVLDVKKHLLSNWPQGSALVFLDMKENLTQSIVLFGRMGPEKTSTEKFAPVGALISRQVFR